MEEERGVGRVVRVDNSRDLPRGKRNIFTIILSGGDGVRAEDGNNELSLSKAARFKLKIKNTFVW